MSQNKGMAERLSELRKMKRLTQIELAEILGVSRTTIANYETGNRTPDYDMLIRLAEIYHVSCDYLIRGIESEFLGIQKETGLSDKSILVLSIMNRYDNDKYCIPTVNRLIESEYQNACDRLFYYEDRVSPYKYYSDEDRLDTELILKISAYLRQLTSRKQALYLTKDYQLLSWREWSEERPKAVKLDAKDLLEKHFAKAMLDAFKLEMRK